MSTLAIIAATITAISLIGLVWTWFSVGSGGSGDFDFTIVFYVPWIVIGMAAAVVWFLVLFVWLFG